MKGTVWNNVFGMSYWMKQNAQMKKLRSGWIHQWKDSTTVTIWNFFKTKGGSDWKSPILTVFDWLFKSNNKPSCYLL